VYAVVEHDDIGFFVVLELGKEELEGTKIGISL
jgi:hypothetical protein